jgi:hypothetical protein
VRVYLLSQICADGSIDQLMRQNKPRASVLR